MGRARRPPLAGLPKPAAAAYSLREKGQCRPAQEQQDPREPHLHRTARPSPRVRPAPRPGAGETTREETGEEAGSSVLLFAYSNGAV